MSDQPTVDLDAHHAALAARAAAVLADPQQATTVRVGSHNPMELYVEDASRLPERGVLIGSIRTPSIASAMATALNAQLPAKREGEELPGWDRENLVDLAEGMEEAGPLHRRPGATGPQLRALLADRDARADLAEQLGTVLYEIGEAVPGLDWSQRIAPQLQEIAAERDRLLARVRISDAAAEEAVEGLLTARAQARQEPAGWDAGHLEAIETLLDDGGHHDLIPSLRAVWAAARERNSAVAELDSAWDAAGDMATRQREFDAGRAELEQMRVQLTETTVDRDRTATANKELADEVNRLRAELERLRHELDSCVWTDPRRMSGQPCIGGTRILAHRIAGLVADGLDGDRIRGLHPGVTDAGITAAVASEQLKDEARRHGAGDALDWVADGPNVDKLGAAGRIRSQASRVRSGEMTIPTTEEER